ncbi:hypothetical protein LZ31DRAFT_558846 [Colletotrichum somersetense]|nr:hypothetical protein LZ31DRAFT_558846 [Colletotrichum somersetense]
MAVFGFSALVLAQSESLAPSLTESWGCQPHGDHWHCDGARSTTAAPYTTVVPVSKSLFTPISIATVTTDHDHDHDHSAATGSYTLAPSPTESFGCEAHNDHWHCVGRIDTTTIPPTTSATSPTVTASVTVTPPASITVTGEGAAAARAVFGAAAVAAVAAFVAF